MSRSAWAQPRWKRPRRPARVLHGRRRPVGDGALVGATELTDVHGNGLAAAATRGGPVGEGRETPTAREVPRWSRPLRRAL